MQNAQRPGPANGAQRAAGRRSPDRAPAQRDSELTREDILVAATQEFADKGLSGARIDEIAERMQTSKRMIYYHFHSKEELYRAVLAREYDRIRETEEQLSLEDMSAEDALASLIRLTFDWHNRNPQFVRLVMNENIHHAEHLQHVPRIRERNESVIESLSKIIVRGRAERTFKKAIDPIDLHMNISALCFYSVSNRHTFARIFGRDMGDPQVASQRREQIVEIILAWCRAN